MNNIKVKKTQLVTLLIINCEYLSSYSDIYIYIYIYITYKFIKYNNYILVLFKKLKKKIFFFTSIFLRGYSLIGKTGTLHVLNSGSSPDNSMFN